MQLTIFEHNSITR